MALDETLKKAACDYHFGKTPGKISLKITKPCDTLRELQHLALKSKPIPKISGNIRQRETL